MWLYNNDSQLQQNDVCLISKVTNKVIGLKTKITIVTTKKCKWKSVKDGHKWIVNDKVIMCILKTYINYNIYYHFYVKT